MFILFIKSQHELHTIEFCFSLHRHTNAINKLAKAGMYFWDYGNAFLLEAKNVGADILKEGLTASKACTTDFRYPSYVQHIMG